MEFPGNVDVLVVGAGPTGLMLANQLGRRGARVLIIDRNAGPSVRMKALGVQDENERLLESYETGRIPVAERLLKTTDRAFSLVVSDRWSIGWMRERIIPVLLPVAMHRDRTGLRPDDDALTRYLEERLALRSERGRPGLTRKVA